jgi:heme-degrading monooxygenase HmoA
MTDGRAPARVLLFLNAPDPADVERGYHQISRDLAGTPGLLRNELLHDIHEPHRFVVLSEWESHDAFRAWEDGAAHRTTTAPLRPYQDADIGRPFGVFVVTAAYRAADPGAAS